MQFIDTDHALEAACTRWAGAKVLALDTEFVRIDTYYPRLCLLQVGDGTEAAVIDTLAVSGLEPLLDLLFDPARVKVLHAGSQDLEIFALLRNAPLKPLFDTQLAAELLGDGEQLGYGALVERRLGVTLDKSLTRTDWAHRPLNAAELRYATADVTYLFKLYPLLRDELAARGRLAWLEEDCTQLADPARFASDPAEAWHRLKGLARLTSAAQGAAMALAAWRETTAQRANRPRRWILPDDALYALATQRPHTAAELANIQELPAKTAARHGTELLAALSAAPDNVPNDTANGAPLDAEQKRRFNALRSELGTRADALGIPRGLLANRADLERLVRESDAADIPLARGWRRAAAGTLLASPGAGN